MPKIIDRRMKVQFAKNVVKAGGNKALAYRETFGSAVSTSQKRGYQLFRDPIVQEVYQNSGVDLEYLSVRSKQLMDSPNLSVAAGLIKHYTKPLLAQVTASRTERINVNLFGDLNDHQIDRIHEGRKITKGSVVTQPEAEGKADDGEQSAE